MTAATAPPGTHPTGTAGKCPGCPARLLDRNTAITAMTLADTAAEHDLHDGHPLWPHIQSWAAELGLTAPGALSRVSQPPESMSTGKDFAAELADPEAAGS